MLAAEKVYFFDERISFKQKALPKSDPKLWFPGLSSFFLVASIALTLVIYLTLGAKIINIKYKLFQMDANRSKLAEHNALLSIKVQELSALSRIEHIARKDLGMDVPKERIIIEPSQIVRTQMEKTQATKTSGSNSIKLLYPNSSKLLYPSAAAFHQESPVGIP